MNSASANTTVLNLCKLHKSGKYATLVMVNCKSQRAPRFGAPAFINVLTELNPELLSKNYSETSDEDVFIQTKKSPINASLSNETSDTENSNTSEV